jgi:hypothetical protein
MPAFRLAVPCIVVDSHGDAGKVSVAFAVPIDLPPALRGACSAAA